MRDLRLGQRGRGREWSSARIRRDRAGQLGQPAGRAAAGVLHQEERRHPQFGRRPLIQPADLAASLQSASPQPLILQVGSHVLFAEAHIPGSEYAGPTNQPTGIQSLKDRVAALPKRENVQTPPITDSMKPWKRIDPAPRQRVQHSNSCSG